MSMTDNVVTGIRRMLTQCKVGTPIYFGGDMSLILRIWPPSLLMTCETLHCVHRNPIAVWSLHKEAIWSIKNLQHLTGSNFRIGDELRTAPGMRDHMHS